MANRKEPYLSITAESGMRLVGNILKSYLGIYRSTMYPNLIRIRTHDFQIMDRQYNLCPWDAGLGHWAIRDLLKQKCTVTLSYIEACGEHARALRLTHWQFNPWPLDRGTRTSWLWDVCLNHWAIRKLVVNIYKNFGSSTTWNRSTTHPKFDLTTVQTHDLQIITAHFMLLRCLL